MTSYLSPQTLTKVPNYLDHLYRDCFTLTSLLDRRADDQPNYVAYSFLNNGETEGRTLTYQQLECRSKAIAAHLQRIGAKGQRALLLYAPGLDFISAFFGCLYAGVIAVPVYPPRRNQSQERLESIIENSRATIALSTSSLIDDINHRLERHAELSALTWIATDSLEDSLAGDWQRLDIDKNSIAFLQYTSGSTGIPKGVIVTHGNLIHNSEQIYQGFGHHPNSQGVIWLPLYHDMGLIGGVIQPLYGGFPVTLMSPVDFLQKPLRWLEAISQFSATTSGGPNFAYELVTRKVTPEQLETLDLSSWDLAFTGAEPIRAETLSAFAEKFADCGFRKEAFYSCYGMAEATLFISGGLKNQEPFIEKIDEEVLAENQVVPAVEGKPFKTLVGCGHPRSEQKVLIVDPETLTQCATKQVGEIWVSGSSIAIGYWNQAEKTEETFNAYLKDTGEGPFLRTGDLGFLRADGELFMTGRIKDVIIIRGRNHYPQDIEQTAEQAHTALIAHRSAAFSLDIDGEEKLMIAVEVERRFKERRQAGSEHQRGERRKSERRIDHIDPGFDVDSDDPPIFAEIVGNIRQVVTANHGLQVYGVLLLRVGSIPKTSSGKIQRFACRKGLLEKSLTLVHASPSHF